ncbi:MAG: substrate-binding domain-containing protein [Blautia sp.]|nr:substrate-binding domain-containing protein [Lachnoclostridium sp.]MCM1211913.1 substrate-binding domain-containing protein [Blautia sp.]
MTRNKLYFGISILVLAALIGWTFYSMLSGEEDEEPHLVSVIVNDSNNDRWIALRLGLEQAAKDYNIDLNYVSTGKFTNAEEEMALIYRELESGAEGIIVQMISGEETTDIADISTKASLVLLESDVTPEDVYALVEPDNVEIGRMLAESVKEDFGEELEGKKIGILSGGRQQLSVQQRLQGVEEGFREDAVTIVWNRELHYPYAAEDGQLERLEEVDIMIALGNDETEILADYLYAQSGTETICKLYGVGCSEKAVYYLDKGMIQTLVTPNEFNMGYRSMEAVAAQIQYYSEKAKSSQVGCIAVNRANMYDEENEKILFPNVQ